MTQEFTASIQELSETTRELTELVISDSDLSPQDADALVKKADDNHHVQAKKSSIKPEPSIKVEGPDPDLAACSREQKTAARDISPGPSSEDIKMPSAAKSDSTESTVKFSDSSSEHNIISNTPKKTLKRKRTPSSVKPLDTPQNQNQLCLSCSQDWGKPLQPGERLLDCLATSENGFCCDKCARGDSTSELLPSHLVGDLVQLKREMNNALDAGDATEESSHFLVGYQGVSSEVRRLSNGTRALSLKQNMDKSQTKVSSSCGDPGKNADKIRLKSQEYYRKNTDRIRLKFQEYQRKNADKARLRQQEYRRKNADSIRLKDQAYRQKNADSIRLKDQAYRQKNADKIRLKSQAYYRKNPDKARLRQQENRRKKAGIVTQGGTEPCNEKNQIASRQTQEEEPNSIYYLKPKDELPENMLKSEDKFKVENNSKPKDELKPKAQLKPAEEFEPKDELKSEEKLPESGLKLEGIFKIEDEFKLKE
ncbi:hypothetical protein N7457_007344 [Penicillium paradoxum]|uniref:uncharacterized protein n=1 Tax=Penicillium paradoxum TaxID=176176 RepID=UPI002546A096|nr:uncharacterized protein N7457_007344 [Penicillium paradoxum]KAJ5779624.1 hypothetical protein N7457_007344 [Penicillium paradoxum]